jgi:hypothetical protein
MCLSTKKLIILVILIAGFHSSVISAKEASLKEDNYPTPVYDKYITKGKNEVNTNLVYTEFMTLSGEMMKKRAEEFEKRVSVHPGFRKIPKYDMLNFPVIGYTAELQNIATIMACKSLGAKPILKIKTIITEGTYVNITANTEDRDTIRQSNLINVLLTKNTHPYIALINKTIDLDLVRVLPSQDVLYEAKQKNILFDIIPIAIDGITVITWKYSKTSSLSQQEAEKVIFGTRKYKPGDDPYVYLASGSFSEYDGPFTISYCGYKYFNVNPYIKIVAVDGKYPGYTSIQNKIYPFTYEIYAVIRSDEPANSPARRLRNWLLTKEGKQLIELSGYIPIK